MKILDIIESVQVQGLSPQELSYFQSAANTLHEKLNMTTSVIVEFKPNADLDKSQNGATIAIGENPKTIYIFIDHNLTNGKRLLALSHEMIHANQFDKGKLAFTKFYNGRFDGFWDGNPITNQKYSRSNPWEIEAHKDERSLMHYVIDTIGNVPSLS